MSSICEQLPVLPLPERPLGSALRSLTRLAGSWEWPRLATAHLPTLILVLLGVFERLVAITGTNGTLNSDQTIAGLIAVHVLHGQFTAFYWGQHYGGTIDAFLMAPFVWLAPGSPLALHSSALIESGLLTLVIWRIMRRSLSPERAAFVAAGAFAFPAYSAAFSTRPMLFYDPTILLGLLLLLFGIRMVENPRDWRNPLAWGLVAGLGWWTSPTIAIFGLASIAWLGWHYKVLHLNRAHWLALPASVVGALPWIYNNLTHSPLFWSLRNQRRIGTYAEHARVFFTGGVPAIFGLRTVPGEEWIVPANLGVALSIVLAVIAISASARLLRSSNPLPLAVCSGAVVIVFMIAYSNTLGEDGRYDYYIAPLVAAIIFSAFRRFWTRLVVAGLAVVAGIGILNMQGALRAGVLPTIAHTGRGENENDRLLVSTLERWGVSRLYYGYWGAFNLDYFSDERIVVAPFWFNRYPPYTTEVATSPDPSFLFAQTSKRAQWMEAYLRDRGIPYRLRFGDRMVLITPAHHMDSWDFGMTPFYFEDDVPARVLPLVRPINPVRPISTCTASVLQDRRVSPSGRPGYSSCSWVGARVAKGSRL